MQFLKVLYIDPGTGGMLFTILFGLFSVALFSVRTLLMKLKFSSGAGQNKTIARLKGSNII